MKIFRYFKLLAVCCFLFSCTEDNPSRGTYFSRCFFLGEKSFTFEGETYNDYTPPEPLESVVVRLDSRSSFDYEGWEISGKVLSKKRFHVEIDTTANGITIDKNTITDDFYKPYPYRFPDDFPAVGLRFHFNGSDYWASGGPSLKELAYLSKKDYDYFTCYYIFVAEPINLTQKSIYKGNGVFGWYENTYYDNLNFSKPGWYKIVTDYHKEISNDPKYSSTRNNYFYY